MVKRKILYGTMFIALIVTMLLMPACSSNEPAPTQTAAPTTPVKTYNLRLPHYFTPTDFRGVMAQYWADEIIKATNGQIKVTVYPAEQLVKGTETFKAISMGTADVSCIISNYMGGTVPAINLFNMIFLPRKFSTAANMKPVLDSMASIYDAEVAKQNMKWLGMIYTSAQSDLFFTKPLHTWASFKGVKIRGSGGSWEKQMTDYAGMAVISMSAAEQYLALQTGTVEGTSTSPMSYVSWKLWEVAPYWLDCFHGSNPYIVLLNKNVWDSFDPQLQSLVQKTTDAVCVHSCIEQDKQVSGLFAEMEKNVKERFYFPDNERKFGEDSTIEVVKKWAASIDQTLAAKLLEKSKAVGFFTW